MRAETQATVSSLRHSRHGIYAPTVTVLTKLVNWLTAAGTSMVAILLIGFLAAAALPRFTSMDVLTVRSGSMEPGINTGGIVVIDRGRTEPQVDDVVTFRMSGDLVTHRIHEIVPEGFVTKGDANQTPDVGVRSPDDVVGTVVFDLPYAGYVLAMLRQRVIFFGLLVIAGGYLLGGEVMVLYRFIFRRGVAHASTAE